jgi:hypothetical protein
MKNLVTAFAACMIAGLVSADGVESQNVVGYTTVDIAANTFSMVGVQFEAVGGGSNTIQNLFAEPSEGAFKGGAGVADSDYLQVWNTSGYYVQYYFGDWSGAYGTQYDNKWYKDGNDAEPTTDKLAPGAAVWFSRTGVATSATMSGQVVTSATNTVVLAANTYTMFSNPYPIALSLADKTAGGTVDWINSGLKGGSGVADADYIQIWNTAGYYVQYYFGDWSGAYGAAYDKQWYKDGDDASPTTDSIAVGGAAWIYHAGSALNLGIPSPLL